MLLLDGYRFFFFAHEGTEPPHIHVEKAGEGYIGRQLKGIVIPETALPGMKKGLALTIYAAVALSTAAWGFVSGGLLYILLCLVLVIQFVSAKLKARRAARGPTGEEMLPLIDEKDRVLGSAPRNECHKGPGKLHPVVHLQIVDGRGSMYLQKRSGSKDLQVALFRELREELKVTKLPLDASGASVDPIHRYRWEGERARVRTGLFLHRDL
ncbi:MAG: DUF4160 domain-containing protein, partial [Spirochaetaceae bacterium]|nr:DUF4160 domain-containing protein [Spirochaetaceae bacterium]